jgi:uncharacterized protein with HEPN domain
MHLNKNINWSSLFKIGDILAHKYHGILLDLLYLNINNSFIPFMANLPDMQLPEYLTLPQKFT